MKALRPEGAGARVVAAYLGGMRGDVGPVAAGRAFPARLGLCPQVSCSLSLPMNSFSALSVSEEDGLQVAQ